MPIDLRARTALVLLAVGLSFAPVMVVRAAADVATEKTESTPGRTARDSASTRPSKATPPGAVIASAHALSTDAGLEIIRAGGNAFDAAIAVSAVRWASSSVREIVSASSGPTRSTFIDSITVRGVTSSMRQASSSRAMPSCSIAA